MRWLLLLSGLVALSPCAGLELSSRHHPVGVKVPDDMRLPEAMKTDAQSRLACATCHGIENLEDRERGEIDALRRTRAEDFLRGGPWRRLDGFCFQCHDDTPYQRLNIHVQRDGRGKLKEENCRYCHRETPDREQPPERAELKLRLPVDRICLGCHLRTPHLNALEHNRKPDERMRQRIRETEQARRVMLPLDDKGRVTCVTCHSPHEKGVIDAAHPAGKQVADRDVAEGPRYLSSRWSPVYREDKAGRLSALAKELRRPVELDYRRLAGEVLMRLPAADGSLCRACHSFDD